MAEKGFHTIRPASFEDNPRTDPRNVIMPNMSGQQFMQQYFLDNPLIKYRTTLPIDINTAEAVGYSGGVTLDLTRTGVDHISQALGGGNFVNPEISAYNDPLITAQLCIYKSQTPPANSSEYMIPLPFIRMTTSGTVAESGMFETIATLGNEKGETDSLLLGFSVYNRTTAFTSDEAHIRVQVWGQKAGETIPEAGFPLVFFDR